MASLSDYLESGVLQHIFRGTDFLKPSGVSIALTSGVPQDSDTGKNLYTGGTLQELPSGVGDDLTGYSRIFLGKPDDTTHGTASGNYFWNHTADNIAAGSGLISNSQQLVFDTALQDWGWVSGIAICDSGQFGVGNLLMHSALDNPRYIYQGDTVKFDADTLQISFL